MNILIVDDEASSVEGIAVSLNWAEIGIEGVYKAYSMQQAQEIFRKTDIDILLCDIEMPKGTGIELVEWVRESGYSPVCIFLTCFSRFDYASSAIRLKIFDYVLKPCEYKALHQLLVKAVGYVMENRHRRLKEQHGQYWDDNYKNLVASFWDQLLTGTIAPDMDTILHECELHHIDNTLTQKEYYLLLLQHTPKKEKDLWDDSILQDTVNNVMAKRLQCQAVLIRGHRFVSITSADSFSDADAYDKRCNELVAALHDTFPAEFFGHYTLPCTMDQAAERFRLLEKDAQQLYALQSTVFRHGKTYTAYTLPEVPEGRWQNALLEYKCDVILDDIQSYLVSADRNTYIDRKLLQVLYHHLLNTVYYVLDIHQLSVHQPFLEKSSSSPENVFNSIPDFIGWVQEIIEQTIILISKDKTSSSMHTLVQYIRENLDCDLSRTHLAGIVHMHPDYLSALFRQKNGCSLTKFITKERISAAKKLLLSTDQSISEIALQTGFQTSSYFSKQFKHMEHTTPYQYRMANRTTKRESN